MEDELKRLMNLQEDAKRLTAHPKPLNEATQLRVTASEVGLRGYLNGNAPDNWDELLTEVKRQQFNDGYRHAIEKLESDKAGTFALSLLEQTRCSKNDAHINRHEWADWLKKEFK